MNMDAIFFFKDPKHRVPNQKYITYMSRIAATWNDLAIDGKDLHIPCQKNEKKTCGKRRWHMGWV